MGNICKMIDDHIDDHNGNMDEYIKSLEPINDNDKNQSDYEDYLCDQADSNYEENKLNE